MICPEVLALFAIECVHKAMVGDPVFANESAGQGFHQADIVQSTIGVDCDAQRTVRPHTWILAFDFPRRVARHIDVPFARNCARKNPCANDLLKGAPRRVMVDDPELLCDLDFRQVWVDGDPGVESSSQLFSAEIVVQRNHLFDERSCANFVNQSLVVALTCLDVCDPVGHGSSVPRRRHSRCGRGICLESSRSDRDPVARAGLCTSFSCKNTYFRN